MKSLKIAIAASLLAMATATSTFAETDMIRITKQPGALYAPVIMLEQQKILEKHLAAKGLGAPKIEWVTVMSGGAANDALLANGIDIVVSGVSNMLLLWGKTNGDVKAITGLSGLPFKLVTRNPNIKTIKDFTPNDRISLPTIKMSMQAITLGIALQKAWGDDKANEKLLTNQVQMGHPDGLAAILNPVHEVTSHFTASPYQEIALKQPGVHEVLNSLDAVGEAHIGVIFSTQKFVDANPKLAKAFVTAYDEAIALMKKDHRAAAETYIAVTKEKIKADELVPLFTQPGAVYQAAPVRTMVYATYMWKVGFVKKEPKSWKDYFFPFIHDREGS